MLTDCLLKTLESKGVMVSVFFPSVNIMYWKAIAWSKGMCSYKRHRLESRNYCAYFYRSFEKSVTLS